MASRRSNGRRTTRSPSATAPAAPPPPGYTKNGEKIGRPLLPLDPDEIGRLAGIGCTMEEIALVKDCSVDTLENRFSDVIQKGRAQGRMSLRRTQFVMALGVSYKDPVKGDVYTRLPDRTMLVWLGKVVLGQRETTLVQMQPSGSEQAPAPGPPSEEEVVQHIASVLSMAEARAKRAQRDTQREEAG